MHCGPAEPSTALASKTNRTGETGHMDHAHILRRSPVQALGPAERPKGRPRPFAVAPRRLAQALGRQRHALARRTGPQRAVVLALQSRTFPGFRTGLRLV